MNRSPTRHWGRELRIRSAFTLLELVVAMSLMSLVMTATASVLRTSRTVWEAQEADVERLRSAHAVVRHIVRETREAKSVVIIDTDQATNARLSIHLSNGDELTWQHDAVTRQVLFTQTSVSSSAQLLAEFIETLEFRAKQIDLQTHNPNAVAETLELTILAGITLPREVPVTRQAVSSVWLRPFGKNRGL